MPDPALAQLAELKIPAQGEFVGVAKRVATSLGGLLGFSLEDIDEVAIAVAQACSSLIQAADEAWGPGATLKLNFARTERGIEFEVDAVAPRSREALAVPRPVPGHDHSAELEIQQALAREMIRLLVDDFRHQVDTGRRQIRYRMVKYLVS
jgi:anti-sigma regulatory factor (Ser/Thr protein kinase)